MWEIVWNSLYKTQKTEAYDNKDYQKNQSLGNKLERMKYLSSKWKKG